MTDDDKNPYKSGKKQKPTKFPVYQHEKKYNCVGASLQDVERLMKEGADEKRKMDLTIEEILLMEKEFKRLEKTTFFFIHISHFLRRTAGCIWPCELAMTEFCIENGVVDTLHMVNYFILYQNCFNNCINLYS